MRKEGPQWYVSHQLAAAVPRGRHLSLATCYCYVRIGNTSTIESSVSSQRLIRSIPARRGGGGVGGVVVCRPVCAMRPGRRRARAAGIFLHIPIYDRLAANDQLEEACGSGWRVSGG